MINKKLSKNLLAVVSALLITLGPSSMTASVVYAAPALPSAPSTPTSPELPTVEMATPDQPSLPSSTDSSSSGTQSTPDNTQTIDPSVDAGDQTGEVGTPQNTSLQSVDPSSESTSLDSLAGNDTTGAGSDNSASSNTNSSSDLTINNNFSGDSTVYANANTGDNTSDKNTGDGQIISGDSDLVLTALNVDNNVNVGTQVFNVYDDQTGDLLVNYNNVKPISNSPSCGNNTSSNQTTGSYSSNDASTTCTDQNTLLIDNNGNLVNNYYLSANTGDNSASKNTGNGSVTTGDANVALNVINFLNNTFLGGAGQLLLGVVNVFGKLSGNIVLNMPSGGSTASLGSNSSTAANNKTGSGSDNSASTTTSNTSDLSLNNNLNLANNIKLFGDTGGNDSGENTGSGSTSTGDVNSNLKVTNIGNTNGIGDGGTLWLVLVNNLGKWTGQVWGFDSTGTASPFFTFSIGTDGSLNAGTGAGSKNSSSNTTTNSTSATLNNNANVKNNIYINANTGGNSAEENTGNGTIKTGDVNVAANILNMINNNFIGTRFVVTIVNVFGSFLGNVFPGGSAQEQKAIKIGAGTSVAIEAGGVVRTTTSVPPTTGFVSPSQEVKSESKAGSGALVSDLTSLATNSSVNSITKVVGKDSPSLKDYWWVIVPLLISAASITARKRFVWKSR